MSVFKHENIIDHNHLQVYFDIPKDEKFICPSHWHTHLEILFVLSGDMTAMVNSNRYELHPFDMLVINSNDIHSTYIDSPVSYILLQIPEEYAVKTLPEFHSVRFQEHYPNTNTCAPYFHLANMLCTMKEDYEQKKKGYELHFTSCLFSLLYELYINYSCGVSSLESAKTDRDTARIETCIRYVRLHYTESISLADMASVLYISKEYFCRLFREYTGQTFLEYVNTFRMVRFYVDLLDTKESISFLLEKHGIQNYKVFLRDFKKLYHDTPGALRRKQNQVKG